MTHRAAHCGKKDTIQDISSPVCSKIGTSLDVRHPKCCKNATHRATFSQNEIAQRDQVVVRTELLKQHSKNSTKRQQNLNRNESVRNHEITPTLVHPAAILANSTLPGHKTFVNCEYTPCVQAKNQSPLHPSCNRSTPSSCTKIL